MTNVSSMLTRMMDALGLGAAASNSPRLTKPTARPAVEILEDRTVPANFGTVQGVLFIDANSNGILDSRDARIPGTSVRLIGTTAGVIGVSGNTTIQRTVTTDINGGYRFTNVPEGTYRLQTGNVTGLVQGAGQTFNGVAITAAGAANQLVKKDFLFRGGLRSRSVSIGQFLTTTNVGSFPYGSPGSGTAVANHNPVVSRVVTPFTLTAASASRVIDLAGNFRDADFTNSQVTFNVTNGTAQSEIRMTLFDTQAPQTVSNFFNYVTAGDYNNDVFHRLAKVAVGGLGVLQGGALKFSDPTGTDLDLTTVRSPVPSEFLASNSNRAGTIAMAQSGGNINSATNQFFFNTVNNATVLDPQRFTVFGKASDNASLQALSTLAQTATQDLSTTAFATAHPTALVNAVPLTNYAGPIANFPTNAVAANYMRITSIEVDRRDEFLTFSVVSNSDPTKATVTIQNEFITVNRVAAGTTTITVRATDRFGSSVTTTINVTVT